MRVYLFCFFLLFFFPWVIVSTQGSESLARGLISNGTQNHTITFSVSENPIIEVSSSYLQKCGILYFLPEGRSRMRVYLFVFFPRGDHIDPVVRESCERAHSNGNEKF